MKPKLLNFLLVASILLLVVAACAAPATSSSPVVLENGVRHLTVANSPGADEYHFLPASFNLNAGKVQFTFENNGSIVHELMLLNAGDPAKLQQFMDAHMSEMATGMMAEDSIPGVLAFELEDVEAGTSQTSEVFDLAPGTYMIACLKPGHYEAGMYVTFTVSN
jgi:uncharacterized cupredoxin-like copper-binding protein